MRTEYLREQIKKNAPAITVDWNQYGRCSNCDCNECTQNKILREAGYHHMMGGMFIKEGVIVGSGDITEDFWK